MCVRYALACRGVEVALAESFDKLKHIEHPEHLLTVFSLSPKFRSNSSYQGLMPYGPRNTETQTDARSLSSRIPNSASAVVCVHGSQCNGSMHTEARRPASSS